MAEIQGLFDETTFQRRAEIQRALRMLRGASGPPMPDDLPAIAGILWKSFAYLKKPAQDFQDFKRDVADALKYEDVDLTPSVAPLPTGRKPPDTFFSLAPRATITPARARKVADALATGRETPTGAALAITSTSDTMTPERRRAVVDQLVSGRGSHTTGAALAIDDKASPPERRQQIVDELEGTPKQGPTPDQQRRSDEISKRIRDYLAAREQDALEFRLQSLENFLGIANDGCTLP